MVETSTFSRNRDDRIEDLLWSLWAELGVPGWERKHRDWCIDPEALLLLTACCVDLSGRLKEEALSWTIQHSRLLSAGRFKNLLKGSHFLNPAIQERPAQEFLATIRSHTHLRLPSEIPGQTFHRLKDPPPLPLERPALLGLRLRSIFGVGARSEVLRLFLLHPDTRFSSSHLLEEGAGFTKRAVQNMLDELTEGKVLSRKKRGNTWIYRLEKGESLRSLVAFERIRHRAWIPVFDGIVGLRGIQWKEHPSKSTEVLKRRAQARKLDLSLQGANLRPIPHEVLGDAFWRAFYDWADDLLREVTQEVDPGLPERES